MIESGVKIAGKYRVERTLGRGGMGYVVQAFHEQLVERVAIKFMNPELSYHSEAVTRFLREARAAFRIRSEHVARVLDVGEHEGAPFMVMELLTGHDLATAIAERPVPAEEAVIFMLQICEALAAAHALGIVHRDLKPSNLFLTRSRDGAPVIKVLDFGISKATLDPSETVPVDILTVSHRLLGSPHYMSPEQARTPGAADVRSDIWSLGVVLYELVLGERPFRGETPVAVLSSLLSDPVPALTPEQSLKMPAALMDVILRCLKREPDARFANVAELARALQPMAPPHSGLIVRRIEGALSTVPYLEPLPPPSPAPASPPSPASPVPPPSPPLPNLSGSTLVSARSASGPPTSTTHLLDSTATVPMHSPIRARSAVLLVAIVAIAAWLFFRPEHTREQAAFRAAAGSSFAKAEGTARVAREPQPQSSGPSVSAVAVSASAAVAEPSASAASPQKNGSRPKLNVEPAAHLANPASPASATAPSDSGVGRPSRPARPSSTVDPKNQPE